MADLRPTDRELYLARVVAGLRLPPGLEREVTDELAAHIADSVDALRDAGLESGLAEREALARLGNPDDLAGGIRRAHQTRRRLLAAAGVGALVGVRSLVAAMLALGGAITVLGMTSVFLWGTVVEALGRSVSGFEAAWAWPPLALLGLTWAARTVARSVAARSRRRVEDVGPATASVVAAAVGVVSLFVIRLPLDLATVAVLVLSPIAAAAGAITAAAAVPRIRPVVVPIAVAALLALNLGGTIATTTWNPLDPDNPPVVRLPLASAYDLPADVWPAGTGSISAGRAVESRVSWAEAAVAAAWSDLRLEVWRATDPRSAAGIVGDGPVAVHPMRRVGLEATLTIELPRIAERAWYLPVITAVGPGGRRYALTTGGEPWRVEFVGSAWDWLTTR